MRHYPTNSPEALARVVAIAMMADGAIDSSELKSLERHDIINRLGLDHERFDQVFYEYYEDLLSCAHRLPSGQFELDAVNVGLLLDEIRDPLLQKKALRAMLDIVNADRRLTGMEAGLIAQALKHWGIDLYEVSDTSIPSHRLPLPKVAEIHLA
jgi:uncharacterized tellurite resistance protein B-like protein